MFVCPNCGYRDLPCWRTSRYQRHVIYCHITELEALRPELAARLRLEPRLDKGSYHYCLRKTGYVYRTPVNDKWMIYNHGYTERPRLPLDPKQRQLDPFLYT